MTRWARGGTANKKKALSATPWSELVSSKECTRTKEKYKSSKIPEADVLEHRIMGKKKFKHKQNRKKSSRENLKDVTMDEKETNFIQKKPSLMSKSIIHKTAKDEVSGLLHTREKSIKATKTCEKKEKGKISNPKKELGISLHYEIKRMKQDIPNLDKTTEKQISELVKKDERRERRRMDRKDKRAMQKLCFNCRKPGHDMSECPEAKMDISQGTGICFKCGSTEHSVATCRLKLSPGEYPYAKCFICGEMGHLSKQCPDNPRGLYPKGGCCRLCGSVEHYRKDCPDLQKQQGIRDFTLPTLSEGHFSVDDEISLHEPGRPIVKKTKSKVVFF